MRASFRIETPDISKTLEERISQQRRYATPHMTPKAGCESVKELLHPCDMCTPVNSAEGKGDDKQ